MFPLSLLSIFTKMCNITPQLPITPLHLGLTNSVVWLPIHSIISKPYSHTQELCQIYCFTVDPVRTQVPKVAYYMESRKLLVAASLQPCSPLSWKATYHLPLSKDYQQVSWDHGLLCLITMNLQLDDCNLSQHQPAQCWRITLWWPFWDYITRYRLWLHPTMSFTCL